MAGIGAGHGAASIGGSLHEGGGRGVEGKAPVDKERFIQRPPRRGGGPVQHHGAVGAAGGVAQQIGQPVGPSRLLQRQAHHVPWWPRPARVAEGLPRIQLAHAGSAQQLRNRPLRVQPHHCQPTPP